MIKTTEWKKGQEISISSLNFIIKDIIISFYRSNGFLLVEPKDAIDETMIRLLNSDKCRDYLYNKCVKDHITIVKAGFNYKVINIVSFSVNTTTNTITIYMTLQKKVSKK